MGYYIDMVNVHYGDCFMLTLDDDDGVEHYVLIDGGRQGNSTNMVQHVKQYASTGLDLVIGTHLDDDHIGGLSEVLNAVSVRELVLNVPGTMKAWLAARDHLSAVFDVVSVKEMVEGVQTADSLVKLAQEKGIKVTGALRGESWQFGEDISLAVVSPTDEMLETAWADQILEESLELAKATSATVPEGAKAPPPTTASNNSSIVLELWYKGKAEALFTGDAGATVLKDVVSNGPYSYLKVPHHGSKTGLDDELVERIRPEVACVPVGPNHHGHPEREVLEALRSVGAKILCSEKTDDCYPGCQRDWGNVICHRGGGKPSRPGWSAIDAGKCPANK